MILFHIKQILSGVVERMRKIILSSMVFVGLVVTGAMAQGSGDLVRLASKQEALSQDIGKVYRMQDGSSLRTMIKSIKSGQKILRARVDNPELRNLLTYLNVCLNELEKVAQRPYTSMNAEKVLELSHSLSEGSRYIVASLKR